MLLFFLFFVAENRQGFKSENGLKNGQNVRLTLSLEFLQQTGRKDQLFFSKSRCKVFRSGFCFIKKRLNTENNLITFWQ